jgi:hypothetical protein
MQSWPKVVPFVAVVALAASLVLCCSGCISEVTNPGALPFEEKIVIRGLLIAGEPVQNIQISRTIPILNDLSDSAFAVRDAQATIAANGREYPLTLQQGADVDSTRQRSLYEAKNLLVQEGQQYTITVQWNGKTATANTTVPTKPVLASATLFTVVRPLVTTGTITPGQPPQLRTIADTLFAADTRIRSRAAYNAAYNAGLFLADKNGQPQSSIFIGETLLITPSTADSSFSLVSGRLPSQYKTLLADSTIVPFVRVFAYDEPYYRYVLTRDRARQAASPLGGAGENVLWNVEGDGIGVFIGVAVSSIVVRTSQ